MIFTVPKPLYIISDGTVIFKDQEIAEFVERQRDLSNCDADTGAENSTADDFVADGVDFVAEGAGTSSSSLTAHPLKREHPGDDSEVVPKRGGFHD